MKKVVVVAFFTLMSVQSYSVGGGEKDKSPKTAESTESKESTECVDEAVTTIIDTVAYSFAKEDPLPSYEDSLALIPSHALYETWDTTKIHPYKYDVTGICDTSLIDLCSESSCGYVHPFNGVVTSNFGPRWNRYHYGIDIDLETGDYVGVAFDGVVRIVKYSRSYGRVVVVRHSNGLETFYAHLSKTSVHSGQSVSAGDLIGYGGNTGNSTGSHLHFEVRYMGKAINPNSIISFEGHLLSSDSLTLNKETFAYIAEAKKLAARYRVHVVRSGDTLSHIAKKYRTSVNTLCRKNRIRRNGTLRIGQKIKI